MIFGINRVHFFIILSLFLFIHTTAFLVYGIRSLHDGDRYIAAAEVLIKDGKLVQDYRFFYSLHVILISAFVVVFKHPVVPFIIFQIIIYGFGLIAFYKTTRLFFGDLSGLIACCTILLWWDLIHWNTTTMTECLFSSAMFFLFFSLTRYKGQLRQLMPILVFVLMALLIRATGVLAAFAVAVFFLSFYWNKLKSQPFRLVALLFAFVTLTGFCTSLLFQNWDFTDQLLRGNIITYADQVESQFKIHEFKVMPSRTDIFLTSHKSFERFIIFIYHNPLEFLKAGLLKITLLITGFRPYYSVWHNVFSVSWVLLIYCAFWLGLKYSFNHPIIAFAITIVVSNCFLIGISTVDWDNRFYIPMEAGVVMIASNGISKWTGRWLN